MHPATGPQPGDPRPVAALDGSHRQVVRFAILLVALNVAIPIGLAVVTGLSGNPWSDYLQGEENAVTWFSSVQLIAVGFAAWLNWVAVCALAPGDRRRTGWIWLVFAAGFVALAADERFSFHERLRDEVVAPADGFTRIAWLEPGDIGLYLVFLVGLACTAFLLRQLRRHPPALPLFVTALVLSLVIVVVDSLRGEIAYNLPYADFWNYVFEEIGELWAQALFALSFLTVLAARLREGRT